MQIDNDILLVRTALSPLQRLSHASVPEAAASARFHGLCCAVSEGEDPGLKGGWA